MKWSIYNTVVSVIYLETFLFQKRSLIPFNVLMIYSLDYFKETCKASLNYIDFSPSLIFLLIWICMFYASFDLFSWFLIWFSSLLYYCMSGSWGLLSFFLKSMISDCSSLIYFFIVLASFMRFCLCFKGSYLALNILSPNNLFIPL